MCGVLGVSRSGFYSWCRRPPGRRSQFNRGIVKRIKAMYKNSGLRSYGSPRITAQLKREGYAVSRPRVARLMKAHGLRARRRPSSTRTTYSNHRWPVAPNLLGRCFTTEALNRIWVGDITYIRTMEGWLYLTAVMDLADRQIIGWSLSAGMSAGQTTIPAWQMARNNRGMATPGIFHSDQGVQYACRAYTSRLRTAGTRQSMARRGDCWDNAVIESFFKTLKAELGGQRLFRSRDQARLAVFEFIECWYNRRRLHSALGYQSPAEREQSLRNRQHSAA